MKSGESLVKLQIRYTPGKCIGQGACLQFMPDTFRLDHGKLVIKNAVDTDGIHLLELDAKGKTVQDAINAALACPVNALEVVDLDSGEYLASSTITYTDDFENVTAHYDDTTEFVMDPNGYFLIKINAQKKEIEVAFCSKINTIKTKITGKTPLEIYQTIIKKKLISRHAHAAYLGR